MKAHEMTINQFCSQPLEKDKELINSLNWCIEKAVYHEASLCHAFKWSIIPYKMYSKISEFAKNNYSRINDHGKFLSYFIKTSQADYVLYMHPYEKKIKLIVDRSNYYYDEVEKVLKENVSLIPENVKSELIAFDEFKKYFL